tara:strand:- start:107 stop:298 length:192 start_codon:yes stop_codon:yes gene_type:complete
VAAMKQQVTKIIAVSMVILLLVTRNIQILADYVPDAYLIIEELMEDMAMNVKNVQNIAKTSCF